MGKRIGVAGLVVFIAAICSQPGRAGGDPPFRVTYLSLDHGCATLVEPPGGRKLLIGAGGPGDTPEILRILKKRGIRELMAVFVGTWTDKYYGGVVPLLKTTRVSGFIANPLRIHSRSADAMFRLAEEREAAGALKIHAPAPGETITFFYTPPCQLRMVGPAGILMTRYKDDPDCSSVLELSYSHVSLLDLGETRRVHQKTLWSVVDEKPRGQVLVIGRDGANDALLPGLLRALHTRIAVLPIPRKSGKVPGADTLKALRNVGAKVYRTDRQGSVEVTTDGDRIDVKTGV